MICQPMVREPVEDKGEEERKSSKGKRKRIDGGSTAEVDQAERGVSRGRTWDSRCGACFRPEYEGRFLDFSLSLTGLPSKTTYLYSKGTCGSWLEICGINHFFVLPPFFFLLCQLLIFIFISRFPLCKGFGALRSDPGAGGRGLLGRGGTPGCCNVKPCC